MSRRRAARALATCTASVLAVWLAACGTRATSPAATDGGRTRAFKYLMGTSVGIEVYGGDAALRQRALDDAFAVVSDADRVVSGYRADSEVRRVNAAAGAGAVPVSASLFSVVDTALRVSRASNGAFDPTLGPGNAVWGLTTPRPRVPADEELDLVRPLVDYRHLALDRVTSSMRFARDGVAIDLDGVGVGFAADLAARSLADRGLSGLVDAGGSEGLAGVPPGKRAWSVGIGHPDRPGSLLGAIDVEGGAVSTVAGAAFPVAGGGAPVHARLDPRTLRPSASALSATVVSTDGALASALARAVFVLGPRDGLALLDQFPQTWGVIAYRQPDGRIDVTTSTGHRRSFHPIGGA